MTKFPNLHQSNFKLQVNPLQHGNVANLIINENILKPERKRMSNNLMKLGNFNFPVAKIKKGNKGKKKNFQGS